MGSRGSIAVRLVCVLAVGALVLSGCSRSPEPEEEGPPVKQEAAVKPGYYDLGNGTGRVVGTLRHSTLEGGFWAVVKAVPAEVTSTTPNVAVLVGTEKLGVDVKKLEGRYVQADGNPLGGVSIRQAGPEFDVSAIREVPAPQR